MHLCFRRSFDDVTQINFRFRLLVIWSSPRGRDVFSHKIWYRCFYPVRSYWYFSEIQDGGRRHLGFSDCVRCVDSVVFVLCTKLGSNICTGQWDRRTYASEVHLMTSRELTSGFDFDQVHDRLRIAVMHLYQIWFKYLLILEIGPFIHIFDWHGDKTHQIQY